MKIGVDLRVLQVGHQYRGIGEVTKQCLNRIFTLADADKGSQHKFIFYRYEVGDGEVDPKEFLDLPESLQFEEVILGKRPLVDTNRTLITKLLSLYRKLYGDPLPQVKDCDVFLQFDYALGVPKHTKTILIAHDIIPFIFWNDYFTSPWVHVRHKAARTTVRTVLHNYESRRVLAKSHKAASEILCVSENTRQDLHKFLHIPLKKMKVTLLGVSEAPASTGKMSKSAQLPTKPFLLFIGGVDARRRRIDDLIAAFNNLKAAGYDIQLALAGENFPSLDGIPNGIVRHDALTSSYREDILPLGYIDDRTKQELFKNAMAFVFPTVYEGFGIMVLEAMLLGCPVVAYKNSSIPEVGGDAILYANNWWDIKLRVEQIMSMSDRKRKDFISRAEKHAAQFTWERTASSIYKVLCAATPPKK